MSKYIKRGEIYYANLGERNYSQIQKGKRPVLIIQNDVGNANSPTTIVAPITSKEKKNIPTHVKFINDKNFMVCTVLLEQIRVIDIFDLEEKIGKVDYKTMQKIDLALKTSLGIN